MPASSEEAGRHEGYALSLGWAGVAAGAAEDAEAPAGASRKRGNEQATVAVRYHFFTGAALLAIAAVVAATLERLPYLTFEAAAFAFLAGCSLFVEGIALWYLPSFAKRRVVLQRLATFAGPVLFPLATAGALAGIPLARDAALALALALFAGIVLASALAGPRWRGGTPFWAEGPHQADDRAAAFTLALSLFVMIAVAADALAGAGERAIALAWPAALALFALGALAHLLPRSRSRAAWTPLVYGGALLGAAGVGVLLAFPAVGERVGLALCAGFALAALGIAPPGGKKRAGPRLAEAGPLLVLSLAHLVVGLAVANALAPLDARASTAVGLILLAALGLGVAALSILTLPVLFNQRPSARHLPILLALATLGGGAGAASLFLPSAGTSAFLLAAALVVWLRVLWPLRRPRRECPPDEPS